MPSDCAACQNTSCFMRKACARYLMVRSESRQVYAYFEPAYDEHTSTWVCKGYVDVQPSPWPLRPEKELA